MKLPSIIKTPRHQRFHIEPRYYDPVKEEIEQRTAQIKRELELDSGRNNTDRARSATTTRLRGAFASKRKKAKGINIMQAVIVLLLTGGIVGYMYYGNIALYIFLLVSSLLLWLKIRGKI